MAPLCAWFGLAAMASGGTIVVPNIYTTQDAPTDNALPFGYEDFRYQQLYNASLFSEPMQLNGIAFRPDGPYARAYDTSIDIQIDLSVTPVTPATMSTTFAANLGPTVTTVFHSVKHIVLSGTLLANGTSAFELEFAFQAPFLYDPSFGNLLVDFRMGPFQGPGDVPQFDTYQDNFSPYLEPVRVFGPVGDAVGNKDGTGLVAQFSFGPVAPPPSAGVPEPGSVWLTAGVAGVWLAFRRDRNRQGNS